ncbi:ALG13-like protein [Mya arenaria]|uniref:ALG13-like protein n=1 Tax=Mya arenaria TaxID=6604 RepID=A0ABY7DJ83_MYAAR|nr:ALG13-like protein [Mya arenaria]
MSIKGLAADVAIVVPLISKPDPPCRKPTPPLPYRIAKALDPCIFRNVELDIWEEECRELKKESPEYRKRFSLGDKCQETEASGEEGYYSNQTSHYHSHQSRSSTPRSCNTPPLQRYKVKPQGYIYPANPITMINGNEAYVGMEMQQVPTLDNENKRNLNQLPAGGVLEPYQQAMMYPQPGDTSGQYMYGPMVAHGGQMYSCVCVPHLDSIAIQDVNVYCPPSQDMAGNDLPEVNTLRFFFNMGVENYRSVSQNGSYQTETTPALVAPGMYMTADQVNGNYFGQLALPPAPAQTPAISAHSNHGNQTYVPASNTHSSSKGSQPSASGPGSALTSPSKSEMSIASSNDDAPDNNDSGCDTESTSSNHGDSSVKEPQQSAMELELQLDNYIANVSEIPQPATTANTNGSEFAEPSKPKLKKRKYYMYGNLKLLCMIRNLNTKNNKLVSAKSQDQIWRKFKHLKPTAQKPCVHVMVYSGLLEAKHIFQNK